MLIEDRYKGVISWFKNNIPIVSTELHYSSPFQLLVAVILSAQCTDKRVNLITPQLFSAYPEAEEMSKASVEDIFLLIKSCSYPNNKAKYLLETSKKLIKEYSGKLPQTSTELQKLPGVGRKTANVISSILYNEAVMPVDTHVHRVSARIGLSENAKNVLQTEKQLLANLSKEDILNTHHWLIIHGRYTCVARKPKCSICNISAYCKYYEQNEKKLSKSS